MTDEVVFSGEHLRAILLTGQRDQLIVTFDYRQVARAGFNPERHTTTFARGGYWQLNIQSRANDWFINPDTAALETALGALRGRFSRVSLVGYSMGGYGALRFARALGADQAVLVSPQASIAPGVVPFEDRYPVEARAFDPDLGDLAAVACPDLEGLVLVDPFLVRDMCHARMILALFPRLDLVRLAFAGHPATGVLRAGGKLWALHREAVSVRRPERRLICAAHREARRTTASYWERLARRAGARRPELAEGAAARAAGLIAS